MDQHHAHGSHHGQGWRPAGPRHRWLEPFVLVLIARGTAHGYGLVGLLNAARVAPGALDVGELYRTLRDLESSGLVRSAWRDAPGSARRREYGLTDAGVARLVEWAEVMRERGRLVSEFLSEYERSGIGALGAPRSGKEA
jgi:DNA-binding PadR family transcriptional regulator